MKTTVGKWGNRLAVRIPAPVLRAANLNLGQVVDVREEAGRIVIEPLRQKVYDLTELLKAITPKNQHASVDFGEPMGKRRGCVELRE